MDILNKYFEKLRFTRVDEKQTPTGQRFAVYGAGIEGLFGDGRARYVLLFVPAHLAIKTQAHIHELPWETLQTRSLHYSYRLKGQPWHPRNLPDPTLVITRREKTHSTYYGPQNFPFEVLLLHDSRKKTHLQYYDKMRVSAALETFASVFVYRGQVSPMEYTNDSPPGVPPSEFDDSFELIS